jgi:hypothetical protein
VVGDVAVGEALEADCAADDSDWGKLTPIDIDASIRKGRYAVGAIRLFDMKDLLCFRCGTGVDGTSDAAG